MMTKSRDDGKRRESRAFRKRAESATGDFLQWKKRRESRAFRKRAESAAGDFLQWKKRRALRCGWVHAATTEDAKVENVSAEWTRSIAS